MVTEIDEGKGIVKTYWSNIRDRVAAVEPAFAEIVDELSPDKSFPLYLLYFPYGALKGDTQSPLIPDMTGGFYRLSDPNAPKDVIKDLGYGMHHSPFGMVLEKTFEFFIGLAQNNVSIPKNIYTPGTFFSYVRNITQGNKYNYVSNRIYSTSAGVRSAFLLPDIGCYAHHYANLQRDYNIHTAAPKTLYDHWNTFKAIANSKFIDNSWRASLIYFSENWVNHMNNDKKWAVLKAYIHQLAWNNAQYEIARHHYDITFSLIQKTSNLKPNPYLSDTARHLFGIAVGGVPGFVPTINNNALPLDILQKAIIESYGLKKYLPTIIHATKFSFEQDMLPIYYSMQYPSTYIFSPKARKLSSTLFEMRELEHIISKFTKELSNDESMCAGSIMNYAAKNIEFRYYHNEDDQHHILLPSTNIEEYDNRFQFLSDTTLKSPDAKVATDGRFVRGCISIASKNAYDSTAKDTDLQPKQAKKQKTPINPQADHK